MLTLSSVNENYTYLKDRMLYFISSDVDPENRGIGWQSEQALMAIG